MFWYIQYCNFGSKYNIVTDNIHRHYVNSSLYIYQYMLNLLSKRCYSSVFGGSYKSCFELLQFYWTLFVELE